MPYSEEELIEELKRVSEEHCDGEAPRVKDLEEYSDISESTYHRRFGAWNNALQEGDFKPNQRRNISEGELLQEIKRVSEEHCDGERPEQNDINIHGEYSHNVYQDVFGGWNDAVEKAGFQRNPEQWFMYSEGAIIEEIIRISEKLSRKPSRADFGRHSHMSVGVFWERFGGWNNALEEAGFEPNGAGFNPLKRKEHPHWKGGMSLVEYGESWETAKKECLRRDKYTCRICGDSIEHEWFDNPDVHHITPKRYWKITEEHKKMNHLRNLISLCRSCHHKLEEKFKGRSHEEFEELAKDYLDIEEEEQEVKQSIFAY